MCVNHQHSSNAYPHFSPPTMFHLRLQNKSQLLMSTLLATLSVVVVVIISIMPSLVLCVDAHNEFAGAKMDQFIESPKAAGKEAAHNSYHSLNHKGKIHIKGKMPGFLQPICFRRYLKIFRLYFVIIINKNITTILYILVIKCC